MSKEFPAYLYGHAIGMVIGMLATDMSHDLAMVGVPAFALVLVVLSYALEKVDQ